MKGVFDYIVVGAGSAGCVLANRLTEDGSRSVALIEAGGPDKRQEIHIPAAFSKLFRSECDWAYVTEEQANLDNRKMYWPRGKVLGGCSSMNAMIYTRGNRQDFDGWQQRGNPGWSFADVSPTFRKAEGRIGGSNGHGTNGPLVISDLRTTNPLSHAFIAACAEAGIPRNDDFDGPHQEGAGFFRVTQRSGKRHSSAAAYLKPALKRPNLTVLTHAHVSRVLLEGSRATGIEYLHNGQKHQIRAEREVILSGGAVNSPQILMLSGIGPADELRSVGVNAGTDLPGVGKNLQDHLVCGALYQCRQSVTLAAAETIANLFRYLLFRKGMLTSNVAEAGAFVKTRDDQATPDLELIFGPTYYLNHGFSNPAGHGFTVGAILLHPKSSGSIRLRSNDPLDAPVVQPRYLSADGDLRLLVEGTRLCRRVAQAKAFDPFRGDEVLPGPDATDDGEIAAFIRAHAETLYHPVGTCRMGDDDLAVVDSQLRVRGIERLRVVDASIMPSIVSGHPNAAVVMIAEKAAETIRTSR